MTLPRFIRAPRPYPKVASLAALLLGAAIPGCGSKEATYEIADVREIQEPGPAAPPTTLEQRFGLRSGMGDSPHGHGMGGAGSGGGTSYSWSTPTGWKDLPPAPMREAGWQPAGNPDTECTFSTAGGGLSMNVNRWRKQMSLDPQEDEAFEALPKDKVLFGRPAYRVELAGTYVGMRGEKNVPDAKLLGLIVELPSTMAFLKMVGPAAVVDAEAERFYALGASIKMGPGGGVPAATPMPETPPAVPGGRAADFQWTVPEGWASRPARPPRVATFVPASAPKSECLVTVLSGTAGGVKANLDLWRDQFGSPPLTDEEFAALPRKPLLGGTGVFIEIEGMYAGKSGGAPEESLLLGMILERPDRSIFVKMTGPTAEVSGERERFRAFCESFRE